jgi:hypothetical protein
VYNACQTYEDRTWLAYYAEFAGVSNYDRGMTKYNALFKWAMDKHLWVGERTDAKKVYTNLTSGTSGIFIKFIKDSAHPLFKKEWLTPKSPNPPVPDPPSLVGALPAAPPAFEKLTLQRALELFDQLCMGNDEIKKACKQVTP